MVFLYFIMKKQKKKKVGANRIEDGEGFQEMETESGIIWFDTWIARDSSFMNISLDDLKLWKKTINVSV